MFMRGYSRTPPAAIAARRGGFSIPASLVNPNWIAARASSRGGEEGGGGEGQESGSRALKLLWCRWKSTGKKEEERGSLFTSHGDTALMWVDEHGDEDPGRIRPLSGSVQLRPTGWMDSQIAVTQDLSGESFRTRIARKLQPFEALREWESRLVKHALTPHRDPRSQPRPMVSGLLRAFAVSHLRVTKLRRSLEPHGRKSFE